MPVRCHKLSIAEIQIIQRDYDFEMCLDAQTKALDIQIMSLDLNMILFTFAHNMPFQVFALLQPIAIHRDVSSHNVLIDIRDGEEAAFL